MTKRSKCIMGIAAALVLAAVVVTTLYNKNRGSNIAAPEYVFTYAENQSEDYPTAQGARYFADKVYEKTNGRIKINLYTDARLGDETSVLEQLRYGGIDFARISLMSMADDIKVYNVLELPYLYDNAEHMWKVLDSKIGDRLIGETESMDLVGLSWYDAGARSFYNSVKEVHTPSDLSGLRIRVAKSSMMFDMIKAFGATPVTVVYADVYSQLETKTIDGAENNWPSYESERHWEVAPYMTLDEHNRIPELQLCSKSTWSKLSDSDREIILSCAKESALYERQLWKKTEESARARAEKGGCIVTTLSKTEMELFREAVSPIYDKYAGEYTELINEIREVE